MANNLQESIQKTAPRQLSAMELAEAERRLLGFFKVLIEIDNEHHIIAKNNMRVS